ncbi:MAG: glycosyltransferase family 2 protein [Planctomycetes bacterium]|nr:glycosyltransferase family 2 protein [Planctomycetota bacterium]
MPIITDNNKILVALPVFNESYAHTIIQGVKKFSLDTLVIDDGSTDGISKWLPHDANIQTIIHPENLGYGKTIIDAFTFAVNKAYNYLLTIDSDGQHEPEEIALFLKEIPFCDCDIVSGSRYLLPTKMAEEAPLERYLINKEVTGILNRITGFQLTDSFCGFKAYKVAKLRKIHLTESGYGMPLQFWIQAWKAGLRVKEIPVKLIYKDLTKRFKGNLENPDRRLLYYKNIIASEMGRVEGTVQ